MKDKASYYKSLFVTHFDGCYGVDPEPNTPTTYSMGVCMLEYCEKENKLVVYLRRPGLLIGYQGKTLSHLVDSLGIDVEIKEINLLK